MKTIGVVIPTLFTRNSFLRQSLESVKEAGEAHVILMGPRVKRNSIDFEGLFDEVLEEPTTGTLSEKLSYALRCFPKSVDLITWIGDDDLLEEGSLTFLKSIFEDDPNLVLAYGSCNYIDENGEKIGQNRSGSWALRFARIGPFLAPQPGSLFRKNAFEAVGGLDPNLKLAFDFELFMALSRRGKVGFVPKTLASFRWHPDSLSVSARHASVKESSTVRLKYCATGTRPLIKAVNPIVEASTLFAGTVVNRYLRCKSIRIRS